jgi:hypothetical protein
LTVELHRIVICMRCGYEDEKRAHGCGCFTITLEILGDWAIIRAAREGRVLKWG